MLLDKEKVSDLKKELVEMKVVIELQEKNNNELREKNWDTMEAFSAEPSEHVRT